MKGGAAMTPPIPLRLLAVVLLALSVAAAGCNEGQASPHALQALQWNLGYRNAIQDEIAGDDPDWEWRYRAMDLVLWRLSFNKFVDGLAAIEQKGDKATLAVILEKMPVGTDYWFGVLLLREGKGYVYSSGSMHEWLFDWKAHRTMERPDKSASGKWVEVSGHDMAALLKESRLSGLWDVWPRVIAPPLERGYPGGGWIMHVYDSSMPEPAVFIIDQPHQRYLQAEVITGGASIDDVIREGGRLDEIVSKEVEFGETTTASREEIRARFKETYPIRRALNGALRLIYAGTENPKEE